MLVRKPLVLLLLMFVHEPVTSKVSRIDYDVILCLFDEIM